MKQHPIPEISPANMTSQLPSLVRLLDEHGAFQFPALANGLFPAAQLDDPLRESMNYHLVWVRDNIHIAHQFDVVGETSAAHDNVRTLCAFFGTQRQRFLDIIEGRVDPAEAMKRPHVRFDGDALEEVGQVWAHNQNDALGYFLWFFCRLVQAGKLIPTHQELETLALFPRFFERIRFWEDEDSGHWEELPKVEASSIGVVVAGLRQLQETQQIETLRTALDEFGATASLVSELMARGEAALEEILPFECIQRDPTKRREFDAALLFLIYPTETVTQGIADRVLRNIRQNLEGHIGIARYRRDTFWSPDYKRKLKDSERTDLLDEQGPRMQIEVAAGQEAQWCLFDSLISSIYGRRFRETGEAAHLELQVHYLNRALRQLTPVGSPFGSFKCPEAYYLEGGVWVPNDATPLLWAHANLRVALWHMMRSAALS
jgi:phosphorylase kinase alpha/beta subunit